MGESVRVCDLLPGDRVEMDGPGGRTGATYVQQATHPLYSALRLVIWRLDSGRWSHDALSPVQHVGEVAPATFGQRVDRLKTALLSGEHG